MTTERDIRNQIRYAEKKGMEKGMEKEAEQIARRMLEKKNEHLGYCGDYRTLCRTGQGTAAVTAGGERIVKRPGRTEGKGGKR